MFKVKNHEVTKRFNPVCFYVLKAFLKKIKIFLLQINIFFMFLDHFDMIILKKNLKIKKKLF